MLWSRCNRSQGVFNTTTDLHKEFGEERVFDMPTSENAMTGVGIGAAIMGIKVLMTHQRLDFSSSARSISEWGSKKCTTCMVGNYNAH